MFYRIFLTGVVAGLIAGLFVTLLQAAKVTPLIHAAEVYEAAATHAHGGDAAAEWQPADGIERSLFTLLANLVVAVGFGLLLSAGFALRQMFVAERELGAREGLLWGLAGFAAFALAPAFGLPPELPGSLSADLAARQGWWIATALATAAGLALIAFPRRHVWHVLGIAALAAPHLAGAPRPAVEGGAVPASLASDFVAASLVTAALFWAVLGSVGGWLYGRFERADN